MKSGPRWRNLLPATTVYAHCDIPCGVYDPAPAQIAARAAHKLVGIIKTLPTKGSSQELLAADNNFMRMVLIKEREVQRCKEELLILWTDYFKAEHLKLFPDLHERFWQAAKQCSQVKRTISEQESQKLVDMVNAIADIFAQSESTKK
jgi:nickel superoxide dismutase